MKLLEDKGLTFYFRKVANGLLGGHSNRRHTNVDDLVQEALFALSRKEVTEFNFAKIVGKNAMIDYIRSKLSDHRRALRKEDKLYEDLKAKSDGDEFNVEVLVCDDDPAYKIEDFPNELSMKSRVLLHDYFYKGLTGQEIATKRGVTESAIHQALKKALEEYKRCIFRCGK